ncbi:MAG: hypothetical protein P9X22_06000 [Candidatus Zapsychrus exili]|nr:hypothetical protein [Candidatus Zapsychrus exili]
MCIFILLLSAFPGTFFSLEFKKGEIVLPMRHAELYDAKTQASKVEDYMVVGINNINTGGKQATTLYDDFMMDAKDFEVGRFYVPVFLILLILLGSITLINRRLVLLAALVYLFHLICLTDATPVAKFLYDHIFFFKYFRNYSHFYWIVMVQALILISAEFFNSLLKYSPKNDIQRKIVFAFIVLVHLGVAVFILFHDISVITAYAAIVVSFVFFILYFLKKIEKNSVIFLFLLLFIVAVQSFEMYYHLNKNSRVVPAANVEPYRYGGKNPFLVFNLPETKAFTKPSEEYFDTYFQTRVYKKNVWMATKWNILLNDNLEVKIMAKYSVGGKLLVYDRIKIVHDGQLDFKEIRDVFDKSRNIAFVIDTGDQVIRLKNSVINPSDRPESILKNSKLVEVLDFDVNYIKLKINFNVDKFLVYNDCYSSKWRAFIDGEKTNLLRANIAFKGLWVPAGEHVVFLRYGRRWRYILDYSFIVLFSIVFMYLLFLALYSNRKESSNFVL